MLTKQKERERESERARARERAREREQLLNNIPSLVKSKQGRFKETPIKTLR